MFVASAAGAGLARAGGSEGESQAVTIGKGRIAEGLPTA